MVESLSKPSGVNPVFTEAAKEQANVVKILPTLTRLRRNLVTPLQSKMQTPLQRK